jgi:hypothetical protein
MTSSRDIFLNRHPNTRERIGAMATVAAWGLFVAFVVHDAEEWVTLPGWLGRNAERLKRIYPRIPSSLLRRWDLPARQVRLAIVVMGAIFALAAADGARTDGRSQFFQVVLIGFGVHALVHVAQAILARAYTPGVITAVLVVAPFSWWAWQQLEWAGAAGSGSIGPAIIGVLLIAPAIVGVNMAAGALARPTRRRRTSNVDDQKEGGVL